MRIKRAQGSIESYVMQFEMDRFLSAELLDCLQLFHFSAYSNVYIQEDEQHVFYFLVEGQVQCHHYHLNGKLAVFALSNPFAAIGDVEVLNEERLRSNVITTRDSILLGIASEDVKRHGEHDPKFLRFLIDQLRTKLYATNELQVGNQLPLLNRLAVYLLAQTNDQPNQEIRLPNKETMASLLGTTQRHLNRVFKQLVEIGALAVDYPVVQILNRDQLEALMEE